VPLDDPALVLARQLDEQRDEGDVAEVRPCRVAPAVAAAVAEQARVDGVALVAELVD